MSRISRRSLVKTAGVIGAAALSPPALAQRAETARSDHPRHVAQVAPAPAPQRAREQPIYIFFNADEAAFIESALARLIPADDRWPRRCLGTSVCRGSQMTTRRAPREQSIESCSWFSTSRQPDHRSAS